MIYSSIPVILLFIVTVLAAFAAYFTKAYFCKKISSTTADINLFHAIVSVGCGIGLFFLGKCNTALSRYTVLLGMAFGAVTMLNAVSYSMAIGIGTFSYTTIINASSTVVTALSGYLFWDESLSVLKICGIVLMLMCYILSTKCDSADDKKSVTVKWIVVCLVMAVSGASIGIFQKMHQKSIYASEYTMFLVTAFVVSAIISFAFYAAASLKKRCFTLGNQSGYDKKKMFGIMAVLLGIGAVCTALNNDINLYLSGVIDSAIFFPIVNGSGIILNILSALLFFKEKLSRKQWLGIAFGIAAIACLCL